MKFSLITVTFNSGQTLRCTLDSVLKQTYKNIEIIIVNDGSIVNAPYPVPFLSFEKLR